MRPVLFVLACSVILVGCNKKPPAGKDRLDAAATPSPSTASKTDAAPAPAPVPAPTAGRDTYDDLADDIIEGIAVAHTPDGSVLVAAATRRGEGGLEEFIQFLSKDGVQHQLEVGDIAGAPSPDVAVNLAKELRAGKFVALTYGRWPEGADEAPVPEHEPAKLRWKAGKLTWIEGDAALPVGAYATTGDLEAQPVSIWAREGAPVLAVTFARAPKDADDKGGAGDSTAMFPMPARP